MYINKHKYLIGVIIFLGLALFSLVQALIEGKQEIVSMLITVIGFFVFMVTDRLEQAATIEKLQTTMQQLVAPLHDMRSEQLLVSAASNNGCFECQRLSSTKGFEYCISKVKSARRMYNTSFSPDIALQTALVTGGYYHRWLQAIIDGITEHDCIVHETTLSGQRLSTIRDIFKTSQKPLKGSYLVNDLSSNINSLRNVPFVEFCIFENEDDSSEVIFGWTSSNSDFLGADCFVVKDKHMVAYFLSYWRRLETLGVLGALEQNL